MAPEPRVEVSPKRVRALLGGEWIADTRHALLVWEHERYPTYYLPAADVRSDLLVATGEVRATSRGDAAVHDVKVGGRVAAGAASWFSQSNVPELADTVRLHWPAMDAWFEEDEEVFVHPRDPHKRLDILPGSRHVRVEIDGVILAESTRPMLLFETGLVTRYYVPKGDVRLDVLTPTDHRTRCPYKGEARYYSANINGVAHDNLAWWYRETTAEAVRIQGLVAFYNERVDLFLDGELQPRPETPFT